jgi:hypothetical protein
VRRPGVAAIWLLDESEFFELVIGHRFCACLGFTAGEYFRGLLESDEKPGCCSGDRKIPRKLTGIGFSAVPIPIGAGTAGFLRAKMLKRMHFLLFPACHNFRLKIWAFFGPFLKRTRPLSRQ